MTPFEATYLGRLRSDVGNRLLLVPGARAVIHNSLGEVLLQHRTDFRLWGLPGGVPEEGEALEDALVSEVAEETGLIIHALRPFGFSSTPALETITFPNGDRCHYFSLLFHVSAFEGIARPADHESFAVAWFNSSNLPEMLPNMRATLDAYENFRSTGAFVILR
jgi:ADP-ribose pyrophosphatase YjhB (NUDIX family)